MNKSNPINRFIKQTMMKSVWNRFVKSDSRRISNLYIISVTGLAIVGGMLGYSTNGSSNTYPIAKFETSSTSATRGGLVSPIEFSVEPYAIYSDSDGNEQVEFEATVENRFEKKAAFQLAYILVDVHGNTVTDAKVTKPKMVEDLETVSERILSPKKLKDGYYKIRVTAVASDGEIDVADESSGFFRVEKDEIVPITVNEWFEQPETMQEQSS